MQDHQRKNIHGGDRKPSRKMDLPPEGRVPVPSGSTALKGAGLFPEENALLVGLRVHAGFQVR